MNGTDLRRIAQRLLLMADAEDGISEWQPRYGAEAKSETRARQQPYTSNESLYIADPDLLLEIALAFYQLREARSRYIPADLLGEPAWDILLDLFIAKQRAHTVSITSACIASNVPPTTALRWLTVLNDYGLIIRQEDTGDKRRSLLRLSEKGEQAVARCLIDASIRLRPITTYKALYKDWHQ